MPRAAQLNEAGAFARAMRVRPAVSSASVKVHVTPADEAVLGTRLGMVVPKKILRTSVRRNAAKRQIRETFRQARDAFPPGDYVVRVLANRKEQSVGAWAQLLRTELQSLWRQLEKKLSKGAA